MEQTQPALRVRDNPLNETGLCILSLGTFWIMIRTSTY